jgi:hypothetical protein
MDDAAQYCSGSRTMHAAGPWRQKAQVGRQWPGIACLQAGSAGTPLSPSATRKMPAAMIMTTVLST